MGSFRSWCSWIALLLSVLSAIGLYSIHNLPPFNNIWCILANNNCPVAKSKDVSAAIPGYENPHKQELAKLFESWVNNGFSTGAQLSTFVNNDEVLNFYVKDDAKYPNFDEKSIVTIFSCTKNFAATLIAIAIKHGWINSYNDKIVDYWPEFPTTRLLLSFEDYNDYFKQFKSNKTLLRDSSNLIEYFQSNNLSIETDTYFATISDVLRHDSGMRLLLSTDALYFDTVTHKEMKRMIEDHKYLVHFKETQRVYHSISRGYTLNQLFINVEPKHRSMKQYLEQEILPKLDDSRMLQLYYIYMYYICICTQNRSHKNT